VVDQAGRRTDVGGTRAVGAAVATGTGSWMRQEEGGWVGRFARVVHSCGFSRWVSLCIQRYYGEGILTKGESEGAIAYDHATAARSYVLL
jgi:hypothetical protein